MVTIRAASMVGMFAGGGFRARALVDANLYRIIVFRVVLDEWHAERLGDDREIRPGLAGGHRHGGAIKLAYNRLIIVFAKNGHAHRHAKTAGAARGSKQHFARGSDLDRELIALERAFARRIAEGILITQICARRRRAGISLACRGAFENNDLRAEDMPDLGSGRRRRVVTLKSQQVSEFRAAGFGGVETANMAAAASESQHHRRGQDGSCYLDRHWPPHRIPIHGKASNPS